jgi:pilus assembly protein CpaF
MRDSVPSPSSITSLDIKNLKKQLISDVSRELESENPPEDQRRNVVSKLLKTVYSNLRTQLDASVRDQLLRDIMDEILGYGPIQPLLDDPDISEIMVNGPLKIYVEKKGQLVRSPIRFDDNDHIMRIIDRIISPLGRRVDADSPTVDARLPDFASFDRWRFAYNS